MKKLHIVIGVLIFVIVVFVSIPLIKAVVPFRLVEDTGGLNGCPDTIEGNYDADFTIKYFYSSSNCLYCLGEEKILEDLVREKGHLFRLEKFDVTYCADEANKYGAHRAPGFVFISGEEYFTRPTYLPKDALERTICRSTGACF